MISTFLEETVTATRGNQKILPSILAPLNTYSGVPQIPTAGSAVYTVYAECYSGVALYRVHKTLRLLLYSTKD